MSIGTRSTERRYVRGWGVHAGWCDLVRWQESMGAQRQGGGCGWFLPLPLIAFYSRRTPVVAYARHPMDAVHGSRRWHAQFTLIINTEKGEITISEEEDRLLKCPKETVA